MTTRFPYLRAAIVAHPWAIIPGRLESIAEVVERRVDGARLSPAEIAALKGHREPNGTLVLLPLTQSNEAGQPAGSVVAAQPGSGQQQGGMIAVLSIMGIIAQHASQVDDISGPGGTSTERVAASLSAALADPQIKAIVLNVDSPGGNVYGVQELADQIFAARGQKPIVAQVNSLAASAAYWIAASADEIVVTPSGQVGSIGVYALHEDISAAAEKAGVKYTFVSAGKFKVEGNSLEPLDGDARDAMQQQVDSYYASFVQSVARGRNVGVGTVRDGFGQGRIERSTDAVKLGMADRVATIGDTLRRLGAQRQKPGANANAAVAAAVDQPAPPLLLPPSATDASADTNDNDPGPDPDAFRRRRHAHRLRSA